MDMKHNEKVVAWDDTNNMIIFDSRDDAEKAGFTWEDVMPLVEVEEILLDEIDPDINDTYLKIQDVWILRKPVNGRFHFCYKGSPNTVGLPPSAVGGNTLEDLANWVEKNYDGVLRRAKSVDRRIPQSYLDNHKL